MAPGCGRFCHVDCEFSAVLPIAGSLQDTRTGPTFIELEPDCGRTSSSTVPAGQIKKHQNQILTHSFRGIRKCKIIFQLILEIDRNYQLVFSPGFGHVTKNLNNFCGLSSI